MSIEKDLQQRTPFADEYQRGLVNLLYTSQYVTTILQDFYKYQDITLKQFNILRILKGAGQPLSTLTIRERMIDRMSDISRIVDRLVSKQLVTKCTNSNDKRLVDISLTKSGLALVNTISDRLSNTTPILSGLSNSEAKQLNNLLDKVRGHQ